MREVRKNDLTAPRHRYKAYEVFSKEFYKKMIAKYPILKQYSFGQVQSIVKEFHAITYEQVVTNRDGIELSGNLGHIFIGACKKEESIIDHKTSQELGVAVKHKNLSSDDFIAKIFFTTYDSCGYKYNELWGFNGCRLFTRLTSSKFVEYWKRYIQLSKTDKVKQLTKKTKIKVDIRRERAEKLLAIYNEFEF